jgi:hypothetical protein
VAYREVGMIEVKEVLRQWLEGGGKKTVARRVGVDPKTARRYIAERDGVCSTAPMTDPWVAIGPEVVGKDVRA